MLASGERLPVLMDTRLGTPLFSPTIYSLSQLRGRNLAANTIEQGLQHIMILLLFLEQREIDIEERFREGRILDFVEIESLANICKMRVADIDPTLSPQARDMRAHMIAQGCAASAKALSNSVVQLTSEI